MASYSIFSNLTPAESVNIGGYTLGVSFFLSSPRISTGGRYFANASQAGRVVYMGVWNAMTGVKLASGSRLQLAADAGWVDVQWSMPATIGTGLHIVGYYGNSTLYYVRTTNQLNSPYVNGPYTVPAAGGRFTQTGSEIGMPTTGTPTNYFADLVVGEDGVVEYVVFPKPTIFVGPDGTPPPSSPTTGQIWPRGNAQA